MAYPVPAVSDVYRFSNELSNGLTTPIEMFIAMSALSLIPIALISLTTFVRNIVVLSFLRQALGLQQTPPNIVLITFSALLTFFSMESTFSQSYRQGFEPYLNNHIGLDEALERSWKPFQSFLISQTNESDLALLHELAKAPLPQSPEQVGPSRLVPAFLLSELKTAFQIGFVIFLPFVLLDLVVASVLMSLGMIMVPPNTVSLPLKIMLFVVVDGWSLIARTLVASASIQ